VNIGVVTALVDDEGLVYGVVGADITLVNLLSNAFKYSPPGSTVQLRLACQDNWATLRIQDQGIGIPLEDQARLFETFHRARNVGNIHGTGLGLTIVKRAVDLHQGTIAVESQVGVGTTFTVTLPLGMEDDAVGSSEEDT